MTGNLIKNPVIRDYGLTGGGGGARGGGGTMTLVP
jgi:hypothetical protein